MGVSVKDVGQDEFVKALAAFLKKSGKLKVPDWVDIVKLGVHKQLAPTHDDWWSGKLKVPDWVDIVKLGVHKQLAPTDDDWWYTRAASVCRRLYIRSPCGVGGLCKAYSGRKNNGTAPSHYSKGSSAVIRRCFQSLEAMKLVEKSPNGGRILSSQGRRDLDTIAGQIKRKEPKAYW